MGFLRLQKTVSFGLMVTGLLLLVFSGELAPPVWMGALFAMAVAWWRWDSGPRGRAVTMVWNAVLVTVALLLVALAITTGNWLLHMLHFGIVMAVSKMFWIDRAKDLFQLYALSFLLVLGGAVTNPGLSFAFVFVVYVVLLTWALILLHLRRDLEDREETRPDGAVAEPEQGLPYWRTRPMLSRSFLVGTSLLALVIFTASLFVFFLFPRLGLGFFFAKTRGTQAVSGFGEDIELGHFGTIRDNDAVVLRVELPDEPPQPGRRLRMRGMSFDTWDGRGWKKSERGGRFMPMGVSGYYDAAPWRTSQDPDVLLRQEIYMEPIVTARRVLFGAPRIRYVRRPGAKLKELAERGGGGGAALIVRFLVDRAGDASYSGGTTGAALRYTVLSDTRPPNLEDEQVGAPISSAIATRYLQLPENVDPRIERLARRLIDGTSTRFEMASALERSLRADWRYSTEGGHDPAHPLEDFLFERREGHCEYFATAMAVMARSVGLPARTVNGFYGGVWNHFGDYRAMRQADAHSWVEVFIPGLGWTTFDPTPAGGRYVGAGTGLFAELEAWTDALRLRWYKWVIEYDLEKQISVVRDFFQMFSSSGSSQLKGGLHFGDIKRALRGLLRPRFLLSLAGILLAVVLLVRLRRWRRVGDTRLRASRGRDAELALRAFRRITRRAARRGHPCARSVSPRAWAEALSLTGQPRADEIRDAAHALEEVVWGDRPLDDERRERLRVGAEVARTLLKSANPGADYQGSGLALRSGGGTTQLAGSSSETGSR